MTPFTADKHPKEEQPLPSATENTIPMKRQLLVRETAHKYDALVDEIAATTRRSSSMDAGAAPATAPAVHTDARVRVSDLRAVFERVPGHTQPVMTESTSSTPPAAIRAARKPVRFDVYGWVMDAADVKDEADDDEEDADAVENEGERDDTDDSAVEDICTAEVGEITRDDAEGADDHEEEEAQDKEEAEKDETVFDKAVAADDDKPQDAVDEDECEHCGSFWYVNEIGVDFTDDFSSAIMSKDDEEVPEAKSDSDSKSDSKSDSAYATEVTTDSKTTKKSETKAASVTTSCIDDEAKLKTTLSWCLIWGWIWTWIWAIFAAIALAACRRGVVAIRFIPLAVKMSLITAMWMLGMAWRAAKKLLQLQCHRHRQHEVEADPATIREVQAIVAVHSKGVSNHDVKNRVDDASDTDETEDTDETQDELTSESESECEIEAEVDIEDGPGMKTQSDTKKTPNEVTKVELNINAVRPQSIETPTILGDFTTVVANGATVAAAVPADTVLSALASSSAVNESEPAPEREEPSTDAVVAMPSRTLSDQHAALELGSIDTIDRRSLLLTPTATATVTTNVTTATAVTTSTGVEEADVREAAQGVIPILDMLTDAAATMTSNTAAHTPAPVQARTSDAQLAAPTATSISMTSTTASRRREIDSERISRRRRPRRTTIIDSKYLKYETLSESYKRAVAGAAAKRSALEAGRERSTWK